MLSVALECFSRLQVKIFYQLQACTHFLFCLVYQYGRVGQSRSLRILFCMPKIKEPMMKRSTFSFFHWNRKSRIGDPVIISSLPFTPETKMSSDSLYPHYTQFAPLYPTAYSTCKNPNFTFKILESLLLRT